MKDIIKVVYNSLDENSNVSCIHVLRRTGRGYKFINDINVNATELYNTLIGKNQNDNIINKEIKKQNFLKDLENNCCFNIASKIEEKTNCIVVYTDFGKCIYSKIKLAEFWITHSNDLFFKTFGFSWIPSIELQEKAKKNMYESKSNVAIGIDIISDIPLIPQSILEDICKSIDVEIGSSIKHMGSFK